jgi:hypothetical protein
MSAADTPQSRLGRWAPGRLAQIEADRNDLLNALLSPLPPKRALSIVAEVESLTAEEQIIRGLLAHRDSGITRLHRMLRPSPDGGRDEQAAQRIEADAALAFLTDYGHLLDDAEFRRAVAGRSALAFTG